MPFRSLDLPWTSQPPGRVGIDPTHPLASKVAFAYFGGNIASHISATTGAVRYAGPYGAAATVTATGVTALQADVSRTVLVLCRNTPASQIIRAGSGGASGWSMSIPAGNQTPVWTDYGVADYTLPGLWTVANQWQAFAVRRDRGSANDIRLFNSSGVQVGSAVSGGSYNVGTYEYISIGTPTSLLVVVEEALSSDAIREFLANPWQLFEPEPIRVYYSAAGGGAVSHEFTLAAFGITPAALSPALSTTFSTPSLNLTPQSPSPSTSTSLAAAAFNFSAQALSTGAQTLFELGSAAFNFTGNAVNHFTALVHELTTAAFSFAGRALQYTTGVVAAITSVIPTYFRRRSRR